MMKDKWYHTLPGHVGEGWNLVILDLLAKYKFCSSLKGKTVLDIGTAEGGYVKDALERGAEKVIGIEHDTIMLGRQRSHLPEGVFTSGRYDLHTFSISNDHCKWFDDRAGQASLVYFSNVSHHIPNISDNLVKSILGTVARFGVIVTNGFQQIPDRLPVGGNNWGVKLSVRHVTSLLEESGFKVTNLGQYRERRELLVGEKL